MMIAGEHNYGITPYINNKSKVDINERSERNEERAIIKMFLLTNLIITLLLLPHSLQIIDKEERRVQSN